jgi:PAS domain S-box-containing protein
MAGDGLVHNGKQSSTVFKKYEIHSGKSIQGSKTTQAAKAPLVSATVGAYNNNVSPSPQETMNQQAQTASPDAPLDLTARTGVIFIVDDEMMVTLSLQTMLSLETPHQVHCFNNPLEALEQVSVLRPDVVISDFSMPGLDGIQFLRKVKALLPESTLILLTGYADKKNAIEAINTVGIYRYIEKPWDNEDLKISIENGLERSRLVGDLKTSVADLSEARRSLEQHNVRLESLVVERTRDLQETYQTLQSIVNNTADGILTLNAQLAITSVNPAANQWLGQKLNLEAGQAKGMPIQSVLTLPATNGQPRRTEELFQITPGPQTAEVLLGDLPLEASISALSAHSDCSAAGFVVVLRDITQRKDIERLRDDFMSTLTHDLRTPLLAAIQTLGFFADGTLGELSEKQLELIHMLTQSNRELLGLVNVLLEVYKYESGRQNLILDTVSVGDLLGQITQELEALAQHRDQTLCLKALEGLPLSDYRVRGDKQELKRVFVNLIGNAINFTPKNGQIQVVLQQERNDNQPGLSLRIQVIDNGRGIPAQDIPLLFQRFSQGTSKQRSSGSGLGLYLSRQIVEAHQGQIGVESEEGKGSRFFVVLPAL